MNPETPMICKRAALLALTLAALAGCASDPGNSLLGLVTPYRVEVVQGNVVTQEMAKQLRAGLSRDQVRGLLGSPLLTDIFHADRWDYVFTIRRQGAQPQQRRVTLYFDNDVVSKFDVPELPAERDFIEAIDTASTPRRMPMLALSDEQLKALPAPAKPAAPAVAASGPVRSYPPLEPPAQ
jgi:outer membrane protein assembly factor BamE